MKKILLATTLLAGSAGYAAADITWAGSAAAGIAQNGIANGGDADPNTYGKGDDEILSYSNVNLAVTFAGTTDGGLTFGATFDMTAGPSYALADDDGFDSNDGSFGTPAVYIAGSFGKITFSTDNLDGFDGDEVNDGDYDVQYDGTFGAVTTGVLADLDTGLLAVKAGYTAGNLALAASFSQEDDPVDDIWDVSATYTMGAIAVTAATDNADAASLKVAFTGANGMSAWAKYNTNGDDDTVDPSLDIGAGYTANGLTVTAEADDVNAGESDTVHWTVTASYDLGGGLSVEAGTNYTEDMMVGAKMAF
jgi:outer membrane protein OmpU